MLSGFFNFAAASLSDDSITIDAVQIEGDDTDDDFIELYNPSCHEQSLRGWKLRERISSGREQSIKELSGSVPAKGYYLWANSSGGFEKRIGADGYTKTGLAKNYSLALIDPDGNQVDAVTLGANPNPFSSASATPIPDRFFSIKRVGNVFELIKNYSPKNSSFVENDELKKCQDAKPPVSETYSENIAINELFPYPPAGQEEFIEIFNPEEKSVDLSGWILRDGSKTGKYVFPKDISIRSGGYLALYKSDYRFALNNSGIESVTLFSPDEKIISTVSYDGAKENLSYDFDGQAWRWSKYLTPGKKNKFGKSSRVEAEVEEKIYVGIYADFQAKKISSDRNKMKYTWDFGDGHKSYKQNTRHKYDKPGKYAVTLDTFDGSEEKLETFGIKVEKFPKFSVKIIALSPNPKGKDKGNEWIEIENNSKKKINLKGWSLATGEKKLQNHPISGDLTIRSGKTLRLTYDDCKFSLNNKSAKVELRYPDGKTASHMKYSAPGKSVPEDAVYEKTRKGWRWILPQSATAVASTSPIPVSATTTPAQSAQKASFDAKIKDSIGKYSFDGQKQDVEIKLLSYSPEKELPVKLTFTRTAVFRSGANYFFTPSKHTHWALELLNKLNFFFNKLLFEI